MMMEVGLLLLLTMMMEELDKGNVAPVTLPGIASFLSRGHVV